MPNDPKSHHQTIINFQSDLNSLANWCYENKLSINTSKTQITILGTNSRTKFNLDKISLTLNRKVLGIVQNNKYLGVLLNPSLTLDDHTQNIIGHVCDKLNTLSHLRTFIPCKTALTIYKSTILPLLEYTNVVFSLISVKQCKKLQMLQNKALSIVYRQHTREDAVALHTQARLASLVQRADRQLTCLMYRRASHSSNFPLEQTAGVTRASSKNRFVMPRPNLEKFKRYLSILL